jgi:hypothetical protein
MTLRIADDKMRTDERTSRTRRNSYSYPRRGEQGLGGYCAVVQGRIHLMYDSLVHRQQRTCFGAKHLAGKKKSL